MKADFSRVTYVADRAFNQVLLQQGRVLLDADFNEQVAIQSNALRQLARDLLGQHAGPENDVGFQIGVDANGKLTIGRGRYYVDGLAAVNPAPRAVNGAAPPLYYIEQDAYPYDAVIPPIPKDLKVNTTYLVYLDVWEETVTALQIEALRDAALGGRDTAVRTRIAWRVLAADAGNPNKPEDWLETNVQRHLDPDDPAFMLLPQLQAATDPADIPDDTPCVADPLGGYRGLENQLYRVEIHHGAEQGDTPTFKWSRDNGSVSVPYIALVGEALRVAGARDGGQGFAPGQWVEITDAVRQRFNMPGVFVRLVKVERNHLRFDPASVTKPVPQPSDLDKPIVRRWDHRDSKDYTIANGAVEVRSGKTYALERGLKIAFTNADKASFRSGDYWLIPARTATATIDWPFTLSNGKRKYEPRPPDGVYHAYAPLAAATPNADNAFPANGVKSLQRRIKPPWKAA